jgi:hypothetical protein
MQDTGTRFSGYLAMQQIGIFKRRESNYLTSRYRKLIMNLLSAIIYSIHPIMFWDFKEIFIPGNMSEH